jgi:hypothetical protein
VTAAFTVELVFISNILERVFNAPMHASDRAGFRRTRLAIHLQSDTLVVLLLLASGSIINFAAVDGRELAVATTTAIYAERSDVGGCSRPV